MNAIARAHQVSGRIEDLHQILAREIDRAFAVSNEDAERRTDCGKVTYCRRLSIEPHDEAGGH